MANPKIIKHRICHNCLYLKIKNVEAKFINVAGSHLYCSEHRSASLTAYINRILTGLRIGLTLEKQSGILL